MLLVEGHPNGLLFFERNYKWRKVVFEIDPSGSNSNIPRRELMKRQLFLWESLWRWNFMWRPRVLVLLTLGEIRPEKLNPNANPFGMPMKTNHLSHFLYPLLESTSKWRWPPCLLFAGIWNNYIWNRNRNRMAAIWEGIPRPGFGGVRIAWHATSMLKPIQLNWPTGWIHN